MWGGSKIVSVNVSIESSCELLLVLPRTHCQASSLVCLFEEDIPGASLNGRGPSQLQAQALVYV